MSQSKRQSMIEVTTNIATGMLGSLLITLLVMHCIDDRTICSIVTVSACTVWSFVRGYGLRRYYNRRHAQ